MQVHITSQTSLRGVAALAVVWGHYADVFARDVAGISLFLPHTHLGVDLFFMLSGFILFHVYSGAFQKRVTAKSWAVFMRQRLLRIYPLHLATLMAVIVPARFELPEGGAWLLALNLTLTHAWGLTDVFAFNAPSWSISAEFAAYLMFPFAVLATGTAWGRLALGALAVTSGVVLWQLGAGSLDLALIGRSHVLWRVGLAFPVGVLLGWLVLSRGALAAGWASVLQGCALLLGVVWAAAGLAEIWLIAVFALLIFATAGDRGVLSRVLAWRPLVWLGAVSYGIYLLQWPIMLVMFNLEPWIAPYLPGLWLDAVRLITVAGLLLAAAALSWRWFEAPLVALGRRRAAV